MNSEHKEKNLLTVTMTQEALENTFRLQESTSEWKGLPLRLYLEGKGCDGFYYGLSFDKKRQDDLLCKIIHKNQTVNVITDSKTLEFVNGSHIIWSEHEGKEGYLVENPKHKRFKGKFYLRSFWKKKLEQDNEETLS